jgi:hypothetical protein
MSDLSEYNCPSCGADSNHKSIVIGFKVKIAELEKDVSNPKGLWVTSKDLQAWKLEQQANACDRIIEMATISKLHSPYMITRDSVIDERDDLRNQAESLKEDK